MLAELQQLQQFHFLRPLWLLALLPLVWLLWLVVRSRNVASAWQKACDSHLLPHLLVNHAIGRQTLLIWLLGLGWLCTVLALAGPTWSKQAQPVFQNQSARVIVLDLSRSMDAPDLKPSRLVRARFKVTDILNQSQDGQVGLVVFAGDAFVVSPITQDADTVAHLLPVLETSLMPLQGSRVEQGLTKAGELLTQAGVAQGLIIVVTDGYDDPLTLEAAAQLRAAGYTVSVLGVGTAEGAPIANTEGELLKDGAGNIVIPRLDNRALQQLAAAGGGHYAVLRPDNEDLAHILAVTVASATDLQMDEGEEGEQTAEHWQEQGPWLLLLLLPLAAMSFRRGWLLMLPLCLAMILGVTLAPTAQADPWDDLWQRQDQQAYSAVVNGQLTKALTLAEDPWMFGTAAYRAGEYPRALQAFIQVPGAIGHFNRGNALTQMERYVEALAAYDAALHAAPDMSDAKFNRDLVEQLLEQQREQQQGQEGEKFTDEQNAPSRADEQRQQDENAQSNQKNDDPQADKDSGARQSGDSDMENPPQDQQDTPEEGSEEEQQDREAETKPGAEQNEEGQQQAQQQEQLAGAEDDPLSEEERQVMEQWLRRIPDDPGGLLRRKFLYQYQRRAAQSDSQYAPW